MTTNRDRLVVQIVNGQAAPPLLSSALYDVGHDGVARILPAVGGITLNVRVGDSAFAYEADHVEPALSARHPDDDVNAGFCTFACVGNLATVTSGEAKGARGVVTGKHGGVEHLMIDFAPEVLERMCIGDGGRGPRGRRGPGAGRGRRREALQLRPRPLREARPRRAPARAGGCPWRRSCRPG